LLNERWGERAIKSAVFQQPARETLIKISDIHSAIV